MSKQAPTTDEKTAREKVAGRPPLLTRSGKKPDPQAVIRLLRKWREEDPEEQRETLEYLMKALDEDRPSYRKLFP